MNKRDTLVSLKGFFNPECKEEFLNDPYLERIFLDICQSHIDYAISIVKENPYEALDIYNELNTFHDILGSMPFEIIDLSVKIVVKISEDDILKALDLIDIIDVDDFKVDALNEIIDKTNDESVVKILNYKKQTYENLIKRGKI